jgi:hypothetical protein
LKRFPYHTSYIFPHFLALQFVMSVNPDVEQFISCFESEGYPVCVNAWHQLKVDCSIGKKLRVPVKRNIF